MSTFHSIVSRRDFMKGLGLAGAGLGGAALASPAFHDLDEVISAAPAPHRKRSWWVKEVDQPTVDIDWDLMARHDSFHSAQSGIINARYMPGGITEYSALTTKANEALKQGMLNNTPGITLRDFALSEAAWPSDFHITGWNGIGSKITRTLFNVDAVPMPLKTPAEMGVPKWTGTPEENTRMMRAVMTFFGAADIGVAEMDEHHKKIVGLHGVNSINAPYWPFGSSPKWPIPTRNLQPVEFGNVPDFTYDGTTGTTTIPSNLGLYSIAYAIPQSHEMFRTGPQSKLFQAANISRYRQREAIRFSTLAFLKGIGYLSIADCPYCMMPGAASAGLTGLTENSRQTNMAISPEHGSTVGLYDMLCDLPMEPTKPVDAGIWRFCHTCGICAKNCPADAIEKKGEREISYEPYPTDLKSYFPEIPGLGFTPKGAGQTEFFKTGRKTYWTDGVKCQFFFSATPGGCAACFGSCVFNSQYTALIHSVVRGTLSNTSMFNGFFASMEETFGFGLTEGEAKENWWDMSLPSYAWDTSLQATHGGYR